MSESEETVPDEDADGDADQYAEAAADLTETIRGHLHAGDYLSAVIYARDRGGLHVRHARALVEHIATSEGLRVPRSGCAGLANLIVVGTLTALGVWVW